MKIIITGATSFIGLHLMQYLLDEGHEVIAVCRNNSRNLDSLVNKNVEIVFSDMQEYFTLGNKIINADAFINLAWGGTTHKERFNNDIHEENIKYSLDALEVAEKIGCKIFVEAGSQAEYGATFEPQSENSPCNPFSEYGKAKLKVKECGFQFSEKYNLKYMHLRIFSMIGENDHPWTLVMSALDKMLANESIDLSTCTQNWNFIYVKDAVRIIVRLCENAIINENFLHEVYNIASNDTRVLKCFVERMKELTCSSSRLNYGVNIPNKIVSLQPNITKSIKDSGFDDFHNFDEVINRIIENKRQYD